MAAAYDLDVSPPQPPPPPAMKKKTRKKKIETMAVNSDHLDSSPPPPAMKKKTRKKKPEIEAMAARSDRRRRNKRRLADRQVYKNLKEAERLLGILLNDCHHQDNDSGRRRKRPNAECSDDADLRRAYKKWVRKRAKTAAKEVRERQLKWSGVGITFDKGDCQDNSDLSGRNPITVNPIMDGYQVHDVLMDGGSSLNVITAETLDELCISRFDVEPVICSFEGVMPGISATSIGQIWISVQLGTPENFRIEHVLFDVVDTNVQLHFTAILGRPAIAQFMAVLHHA